jgi:2-keto-myo-inositol isomerase
MTAPRLAWPALLDLAVSRSCVGVEFRNDLPTPLFSGANPATVGQTAREKGVRIVGLSQVYPFNTFSEAIRSEVAQLISTAKACGAETISLIPRNDGTGTGNGERQANLRLALKEIRPMLADAGMIALVEPLGFERSSLRFKAEAIDTIEAIGGRQEFRIVHDTFHHFLAGETEFFPEWTGIVHISGVTEQSLAPNQMEDEHRVLVGADDRLGNVTQLQKLRAAGYEGPVSFEAFSPAIHALDDPEPALAKSMEFIKARLDAETV